LSCLPLTVMKKTFIARMLENIIQRILEADELHELYLQRKM
jgi:hypothetical protein